jgi:hypothetical protein
LSIKLDYYTKYYSGRCITYRLDRTIVTVGAPRMLVYQPSLGRCLFLCLCDRCLLRGDGSRCSALLRSCGHHFSNGGGCRLHAPSRSRGLALQLHQKLFNSGGWATTPSGFPHRVTHVLVALVNGLRRRHLLQARKINRQQVNSRD